MFLIIILLILLHVFNKLLHRFSWSCLVTIAKGPLEAVSLSATTEAVESKTEEDTQNLVSGTTQQKSVLSSGGVSIIEGTCIWLSVLHGQLE